MAGRTLRFRSILCPVDFSTHSRRALQYAAAVADRFRGRVTALFVDDPLLLAAARQAYGSERDVVERSRGELSRFIAQAVPGHAKRITTAVAVGNPAPEILAAARRLRTDLVVMATAGSSGVQHAMFGSTTELVLRRAAVPVLAIPPAADRRAGSARLTVDRVVVPIDLAAEWQADAIRGADVARMFGVPLRLVHVLRPVHAPAWLRPLGAPTQRQRIEKAERALERVTRQFSGRVESECSVILGEPAQEIARLTERGAPLVVMSLRGTGGIFTRRGAIAYRVLTRSSRPVLALPRRLLGGPLAARLKRAISETLLARDRIEMAGIDALLSAGSGKRPVRR
jgi:nucleotide-binding universal stress UspA family protein